MSMNDDHCVNESIAQPPDTTNAGRPTEKKILTGLLKDPRWIIQEIEEDRHWWRRGFRLVLAALLFYAIFGAVTGIFGGWGTALMSAAKAPCIGLFSLILCMPSLYIFGCIGGMCLSLSQAFALGSIVMAMVGLILLGFVPVIWLFAISTSSLSFMAVFTLLIWMTAICLTGRFLNHLSTSASLGRSGGIRWWMVVYVLVSLQMATTMRPLLVDPTQGWWTAGKRNFVVHFLDTINYSEGHSIDTRNR